MNGGALVIVDQGYAYVHQSTWQDGEPKKSMWTGVKQAKTDQLQVTTFAATVAASWRATP